jgi:hypothetical protein
MGFFAMEKLPEPRLKAVFKGHIPMLSFDYSNGIP